MGKEGRGSGEPAGWLLEARTKQARLAAADTSLRVHGATKHQYHRAAPLPPDVVAALELRYRIQLPEEYRDFLLHFGNGVAGPAWGLERFAYINDEGLTIPNVDLSEGLFKHDYWTEAIALALTGWEQPSQTFRLKKPHLPRQIFEDAGNADEALPSGRELLDGTLGLVDLGCAMGSILVLNGRWRGTIWVDDRANSGAFADYATWCRLMAAEGPLPRDSRFSTWYLHWLDTSLSDLAAGAYDHIQCVHEPEADAPHPVDALKMERTARAQAKQKQDLREERRAKVKTRREEARPQLERRSAALLASLPSKKDGFRFEGKCPRCGKAATLRVCDGIFALCMDCYWNW